MDIRQSETINHPKQQSHTRHYGLARDLGFFDVICLGMNSVVGAGIFLLPGQLCGLAGSGALVAFPLCGLLCFAIALCFAEMGGMHHQTGGAYLYAGDAFGPFVAFLVGWMMWISSVIGWSSVASGMGLYLDYFLPGQSVWFSKAIMSFFIVGLGVINCFGVRMGARTINFFTLGKLLSLLIFISVGAFFVHKQNFIPFHNGGNFSAAALMALYAYTGFEFVGVPAGEMRHPQRDVPRVLMHVLMIATGLYVAVLVVAMGTFPGLHVSDKPLADAAQSFMGKKGGIIIGIGALLSIGGINAGIALSSPRNLLALSADGYFPKVFSRIHPTRHTPYVAIITSTGLALTLSLTGSFQYLIMASVMVSILQYIPTCLAVIILRIRHPNRERHYKIPGGYCVPIVALITCGWLIWNIEWKILGATAITLAMSLPLYFRKRGE